MPEPSLEKNSSSTIQHIAGRYHNFPIVIFPKVNAIARLKFEPAYYDSTV